LLQYGKELDHQEILGGGVDLEWQDAPTAKFKKADRNRTFPSEYTFERKYRSVLADARALAYLRGRGISVNTAFGLGLRFDPVQQRILFPVYDYWSGGRFAGCTGRSILSDAERDSIEQQTGRPQPKVRDYHGLEKDKLLLGDRRCIVSAKHLAGDVAKSKRRVSHTATVTQFLVGVEGLFAYARACQLGYRSSTFAVLGSKPTPGKLAILQDVALPVFWFLDNDPAGISGLYGNWDEETQQFKENTGTLKALAHSIAQFVPTWPEGKDDPDQLTRAEFERMIEEAELYAPGG
jgi:hypothetical protein